MGRGQGLGGRLGWCGAGRVGHASEQGRELRIAAASRWIPPWLLPPLLELHLTSLTPSLIGIHETFSPPSVPLQDTLQETVGKAGKAW